MPDINIAYLELRLSGGALNADPGDSLGGIMSSECIRSKSATGISNITGVVIDDVIGITDGAATLAFTAVGKTLTLSKSGTEGASVALTGDGRYAIPWSTGFLLVTVTDVALPVLNKTDGITITQLSNQLFDDVGKSECWNGDAEYRCLYMHNAHPTDLMYGARVYIQSQPSGTDALWIGADPAGVGDGSATGVATTVATEQDPPDGVGFSFSTSSLVSLSIPQIAAGQSAAIWLKRIVPAETIVSVPSDRSTLAFRIAI